MSDSKNQAYAPSTGVVDTGYSEGLPQTPFLEKHLPDNIHIVCSKRMFCPTPDGQNSIGYLFCVKSANGLKDIVVAAIQNGLFHRVNWGMMENYCRMLREPNHKFGTAEHEYTAAIAMAKDHIGVGCIIIHKGFINFFVLPQYREKGYAKLMMQTLIELRPDIDATKLRYGVGLPHSTATVPKIINTVLPAGSQHPVFVENQ